MSIPLPPYFTFGDWERFSGVVYRWDVDKTYLDTKFESFRQLIKIPFEKSNEKKAIEGAPALARNIRITEKGVSPVCFITSSPKQLKEAIVGKLLLDKVFVDDIKFKDQVRNIRQRKFSKITDHITYKLSRLLWGRLSFPAQTKEILFGDDSEQDAFIYNLYADLLLKKISTNELRKILDCWDVDSEDNRKLCVLYEEVHNLKLGEGGVRRIFIHLATNTEPNYYLKYGNLNIAISNYFEALVVLYSDNLLNEAEFIKIFDEQKNEIKLISKKVKDSLVSISEKSDVSLISTIETLIKHQILNEKPVLTSKKIFYESYWENTAQKYLERFR